MIVFSYLRNPKKIKFKKCRPCVTHKKCKTNLKCQALDFKETKDEVQLWNKEKRQKENKWQEKAS
tara:strand:+ start:167 stop:361 length:195 start_codon:yes stop_codon:yes gene_type:complete